jgi:hypothetical protein
MKVLILLCGFAASSLASPSPVNWLNKRAAAPAYEAHTIDQPVRLSLLFRILTFSYCDRLIIFRNLTAMNRIQRTHSSNDTFSTLRTTNPEGQSSCILVEKRAERVDSRIYRPEVSIQY